MEEIKIGKNILKYQITFKDNKNTYFHFKKSGYIQINASKYQKRKDILKYIKNNSDSFIIKYMKALEKNIVIDGYFIWGNKFDINKNEFVDNITLDYKNLSIREPLIDNDQLIKLYDKEEKKLLLEEAYRLKEKYLDNGLIDISKITINTRSTKTRFGSCNFRLKRINLNLKLVHYDKEYLEYVFLHEISHLVHQNHSSDFYDLLSKLSPNYKELKKDLNLIFNRWLICFYQFPKKI